MLDLLVRYALDHGLETEPGFKPKEVRWVISCDTDGRFLDVIELGDTSQRKNPGQIFPKCPDISQPEMVSGGETKSHFLVDTAEVVALYGKGADQPKVRDKHKYFVKLLRNAGASVSELSRLAEQLENPDTLKAIQFRLEARSAKPGDKVTFKVGSIFLVESEAWHNWWRAFRKRIKSEGKIETPTKKSTRTKKESALMRCFITGELIKPVPTHSKIENLVDVGGQRSGDALICFDKAAFRSYGLEQSANAAVSEDSMSAYRAGLNHLIKQKGQRLAGAKVVHWFKKKVSDEDDPLAWLEEGVEQQELNAQHRAKEMLESLRGGKRPDLAGNHFYALTLSGAGGRVMVRDWMEGQFEELVANIRAWFDDLEIVHREGKGLAHHPKFLAVVGATVRDLKDLPAPLVTKMWRVAVRGEPIPQTALAEALARTRLSIIQDDPPNHARMGLMKAYHLRKEKKGGKQMRSVQLTPYLNERHPDPAYQCGRLMAVLAGLQHAALGDVGAGVVQRYYAAASSTPALVLGRLTRTSQFHLSKLDAGLAHWYEGNIANIWGRMGDAIPRTLSLDEQSLFALGYYQQIAALRTKKSNDSKQEKEENNE